LEKVKQEKFIKIDKNFTDPNNDAKIVNELQRRKDEHYNILQSDEYANIIFHF
jgi:hypothetical protein